MNLALRNQAVALIVESSEEIKASPGWKALMNKIWPPGESPAYTDEDADDIAQEIVDFFEKENP